MAVEWVLGALVVLLAVATTVAMLLGIAGLVGAARLVRCQQCGRLDMTSLADPSQFCMYCRHSRLFHPVYALHHPHAAREAEHQPAA